MVIVYYTTTTNPYVRCGKRFHDYDDAIAWVENATNILDYLIE